MILLFLLICILGIEIYAATSFDLKADNSLDIVVKNSPNQTYYLDLLVNDINSPEKTIKTNISDSSKYSQKMYDTLNNYSVDGWHSALVKGTVDPIYGKLTGKKSGNSMIHHFSYISNSPFKIIIVTADNQIIVSKNEGYPKITPSKVYFDLETKTITDGGFILTYFLYFIINCLCVFLFISLILLLFKINLRKYWLPIVFINLLTQIAYLIIIVGSFYSLDPMLTLIIYIPFFIIVFIIQSILYMFLLKEHSKLKRIILALCPNIANFIFGIITFYSIPEIYRLVYNIFT